MVDRFAVGAARLASRMENRTSSAVTYTRGVTSVSVQAVIGRTHFAFVDGVGQDQHIRGWDFLIRASLLSAFGTPTQGDQITFFSGDENQTYEVMAPNDEPDWSWSDQHHNVYRIHTKFIRSEVVS